MITDRKSAIKFLDRFIFEASLKNVEGIDDARTAWFVLIGVLTLETMVLPGISSGLSEKVEPTSAELERLAIAMEEMGEAVQAMGKILRHGFESKWLEGQTNREQLEIELGDVLYSINLLIQKGDVNSIVIQERAAQKLREKPFTRHQN